MAVGNSLSMIVADAAGWLLEHPARNNKWKNISDFLKGCSGIMIEQILSKVFDH
jgi:hypothetical protein